MKRLVAYQRVDPRGHKAGALIYFNRLFSHLPAGGFAGLKGLIGSFQTAYDFDEFHQVNRIKKMRPDNLVRTIRSRRNFRNTDCGGIGRQTGMFRAVIIQPAENRLLQIQILCNRLDDQPCVANGFFKIRDARQACQSRRFLLGLELGALDPFLQILLNHF